MDPLDEHENAREAEEDDGSEGHTAGHRLDDAFLGHVRFSCGWGDINTIA
jgi:hypothetical protein